MRGPLAPRGRGRPARRVGHSTDAAAASHYRGQGHSAASASTASSGPASTGRAYSGPSSICAASPAGRSPSPAGHAPSPGTRPDSPDTAPFPRGHPSRRPAIVSRTVPRTADLQHEEDALAATALVVLVVGTRPSFAPHQVRRFIQDNFGVLDLRLPYTDTGLRTSCSSSATHRTFSVCWMLHPCRGLIWCCVSAAGTGSPRRKVNLCVIGSCWKFAAFLHMLGRQQLHRSSSAMLVLFLNPRLPRWRVWICVVFRRPFGVLTRI